MQKAQIILYGILNLYSKAVKLALNCGDIELAKEYANKPSDAKTKKKLWMKIAKHLFRTSKEADDKDAGGTGATEKKKVNVQQALQIIKDFSVLKVEDLLDLFPEKAKVEEMKQHLCHCLDDYEEKIKGLRT